MEPRMSLHGKLASDEFPREDHQFSNNCKLPYRRNQRGNLRFRIAEIEDYNV